MHNLDDYLEKTNKIVDNIKIIEGKFKNNGFNDNLFTKGNTNQTNNKSSTAKDWSLIVLIISFIAIFVLILINIIVHIEGEVVRLLWTTSLFFVLLASLSAHLKFKNITYTVITGLGLIVVLLIGLGIFTPEEAVEKASQIYKSE